MTVSRLEHICYFLSSGTFGLITFEYALVCKTLYCARALKYHSVHEFLQTIMYVLVIC